MRQPPTRYSRLQIALHWGIAALILTQLVFNRGMERDFDAMMDGGSGGLSGWAILHMTVGISVLILATLRIFVRLTRGAPPPPADNPAFIIWSGHLNHFALYLLMFAMPLTGAFAWFGESDIAAELHEWGVLALQVVIFFHILGALMEHFVFKQDSLLRIFRAEGPKPEPSRQPARSK